MKLGKYTVNFYESVAERAEEASEIILSIFLNLFTVNSVKDVGCGNGIWLRETLKWDMVSKRFGYDLKSALDSSKDFDNRDIVFKSIDLELSEYDLVPTDLTFCLEVAEHISKTAATRLVSKICATSNYVIFSAATPGQGGFNHINENALEYWISLFEENGFRSFDVFRPVLSASSKIPLFYKNNVFLFIKSSECNGIETLLNEGFSANYEVFSNSKVHDYRRKIQIFQAYLVSKMNFRIVNILSVIKYYLKIVLK